MKESGNMCETFKSAKTIYDLSDGSETNLTMQKRLYLCHMAMLGVHKKGLVSEPFQAWKYGPVQKKIYDKFMIYGSGSIPDTFRTKPYAMDSEEFKIIAEVMKALEGVKSWQLVNMTHRRHGAWYQTFHNKGNRAEIPDYLIREEYLAI